MAVSYYSPDSAQPAHGGKDRRPPRWGLSLPMMLLVLVGVSSTVRLAGHAPTAYRGALYVTEGDTTRRAMLVGFADTTVSLYQLPAHPSVLHNPVIPVTAPNRAMVVLDERYRDLYNLLDLYVVRQAVDDNFTVRVIDDRTNAVLEVVHLERERARFEETGTADWGRIDGIRRDVTGDLTKKYVRLGIPREHVVVRWGRLNQIIEARGRNAPFIAYELRLSTWLGLSLLATQIGTVETFNQDWMVSRVGARSRYQLMPTMLRRFGIGMHTLKTRSGGTVTVREERHPMLVLLPAYSLIRAYTNAVGHEIPGISSYHTGPYNIFKLLELYLEEAPGAREHPNVLDGYVWALTDGFNTVRRRSSFRTQSRGYVPSAYGALRAVEHEPIDFSQTFLGERVRIRAGAEFSLSQLVDELDTIETGINWGPAGRTTSTYDRLARLNPHLDLAELTAEDSIPAEQDLIFAAASQQGALRLFLPLNAADSLDARGAAWFDSSDRLRFDHYLFASDPRLERTALDDAYDQLVRDIGYFGFTEENQVLLDQLVEKFRVAAEVHPTLFRRLQADIIAFHQRVWESRLFTRLAETVSESLGPDRNTLYARSRSETEPVTDPVAR